jgi:hypothetical protein
MDHFSVSGNTLLQTTFSKEVAQLARIPGLEALTKAQRHKNSIKCHILVVINMAKSLAR